MSSAGGRDREEARRTREEAREIAQRAREEARELKQRAQDEARELKQRAQEDARELGQRVKEEARELGQRVKEDAHDLTERAREDARHTGRDPGPIWARPEPGARRPRFTREQIAATALQIADSEGFDAVSMRRVATELGAGTMTLYHYVATKDELVELMSDAIMGEVLVPDGELSDDWREAIAQIAHGSHAAFARHPWAFEATRGAFGGPNGMRHFEQSLAAVAGLDISPELRFEIITLVDDYVFGYVVRWALPERRPSEETEAAALAFMDRQVQSGEYPNISALLAGDSVHEAWNRISKVVLDDERFERGLQQLLDGVALRLGRET